MVRWSPDALARLAFAAGIFERRSFSNPWLVGLGLGHLRQFSYKICCAQATENATNAFVRRGHG
jgi:hypothetical protein